MRLSASTFAVILVASSCRSSGPELPKLTPGTYQLAECQTPNGPIGPAPCVAFSSGSTFEIDDSAATSALEGRLIPALSYTQVRFEPRNEP
jgi:hypothetical protein